PLPNFVRDDVVGLVAAAVRRRLALDPFDTPALAADHLVKAALTFLVPMRQGNLHQLTVNAGKDTTSLVDWIQEDLSNAKMIPRLAHDRQNAQVIKARRDTSYRNGLTNPPLIDFAYRFNPLGVGWH